MDPIKNFAEATLVAGIAAGDTSAAVGAGEAGDLPTGAPWSGVIWNFSDFGNDRVAAHKAGQAEVVGVTRTGTALALVRAQDESTARDFNASGKIYKIAQDLTAGLFAKLAPKADAPLTGNTTYERMSPLIHVHADIASGTLTLHATKANNRVTLTGTAMTVAFPAGDPRNLQTLLVTNSNAADATITVPSSRSLNSNATITNFTLSAGITALLTWYYDGTTYFLLGETLTSSQVKVALALVAADLSDFAAAARAQVEAMLVQSTNVTLTPSGSGASRQIAVASSGGGGAARPTFVGRPPGNTTPHLLRLNGSIPSNVGNSDPLHGGYPGIS